MDCRSGGDQIRSRPAPQENVGRDFREGPTGEEENEYDGFHLRDRHDPPRHHTGVCGGGRLNRERRAVGGTRDVDVSLRATAHNFAQEDAAACGDRGGVGNRRRGSSRERHFSHVRVGQRLPNRDGFRMERQTPRHAATERKGSIRDRLKGVRTERCLLRSIARVPEISSTCPKESGV